MRNVILTAKNTPKKVHGSCTVLSMMDMRYLPSVVSGLKITNRQQNNDFRNSDLYNLPLIKLEQFRKISLDSL